MRKDQKCTYMPKTANKNIFYNVQEEGCVNSQQFFASLLAGFQNFNIFFPGIPYIPSCHCIHRQQFCQSDRPHF